MNYAKLMEIFCERTAMKSQSHKAKEAEKLMMKTIEAQLTEENDEGLLKLQQKQEKHHKHANGERKDGENPAQKGENSQENSENLAADKPKKDEKDKKYFDIYCRGNCRRYLYGTRFSAER